jgi:hypothetical protein
VCIDNTKIDCIWPLGQPAAVLLAPAVWQLLAGSSGVHLSFEEVTFKEKQLMHREPRKLPALLLLLLLLKLLVAIAESACRSISWLGVMYNNDVCIR